MSDGLEVDSEKEKIEKEAIRALVAKHKAEAANITEEAKKKRDEHSFVGALKKDLRSYVEKF